MNENRTKTLTDLIALLEPLAEEDRQKVIQSALIFLGSMPVAAPKLNDPAEEDESAESPSKMTRKATDWLKRHDFTLELLEDIFHSTGDEVEVIASDLPGSGDREQTQQCYLLFGIKSLLQEGEPKIDDKQARQLCQELGCYDSANHAKSVSMMGNQITGNKKDGYTLTAPGLRAAAELITQMTAPKS